MDRYFWQVGVEKDRKLSSETQKGEGKQDGAEEEIKQDTGSTEV